MGMNLTMLKSVVPGNQPKENTGYLRVSTDVVLDKQFLLQVVPENR